MDNETRRKKVWDLYLQGESYNAIGSELGLSFHQVKGIIGRAREQAKKHGQAFRPKRTVEQEQQKEPFTMQELNEQLYSFLAKPRAAEDIKQHFGISDRVLEAAVADLQEEGKLVEYNDGVYRLQKDLAPVDIPVHDAGWQGDRIIRFGVASDKHFNSKFAQITNMNRLYDVFEQEGIENVYDPGDLDEGEKMRKGHEYECYNQGADDHVEEVVKNHPRRTVNGRPMKTYFITGNHDLSFVKRSGLDIGSMIANKRDDMVYLGQSWALINLTPTCTMELRHPADATAYAISYKTQKMIDAMFGGEKPNILVVGHYHKAEYLFYRNVHAIQAGCLQGQTPFMRNKGLAAMMGGWIVEIRVDDEGGVDRIKLEFVPFYYTQKDDYLNFR